MQQKAVESVFFIFHLPANSLKVEAATGENVKFFYQMGCFWFVRMSSIEARKSSTRFKSRLHY